MAKSEQENKQNQQESSEDSKRKVKQSNERLHPLKYNILNNPFFKYSEEKNTIQSLKKLLNLEIMLTLIAIAMMVLLVGLIVRLPSLPSGEAVAVVTPTTDVIATLEPTQQGTIIVDGKEIKDNRDLADSDNGSDQGSSVETQLYANTDLGFTVRYPVTWKLEEPVVDGVKTTKIFDPAAKQETYITFTNQRPDGSAFESTGTEIKRDLFTVSSVYRSTGYVRFGRTNWASITVDPNKFYIVFAGEVEKDIIPIMLTFNY
ncbi:MAG: hypothetical protein QY330_00485 [Candidatus Dojkabacteria bacterium]|uniref:Uncharacterized protein n=2 Tax=Candidatus Dojkabacteria TaxID=74243 RepID=A0A136KGY3_9BACT|nr:MAG: hypothetical protein UZ20_WS6002000684 [candidate division WS6 bacterium OLB21]MBW7953659.1 hypothetical protein [Candidatus Dojkabacteria bacterium]WKZ28071.1 MAG: hypothetical protein QY330_00485 [Candidatus Dojkabacteria bacterium]